MREVSKEEFLIFINGSNYVKSTHNDLTEYFNIFQERVALSFDSTHQSQYFIYGDEVMEVDFENNVVMSKEFFLDVLTTTLESTKQTLGIKAMEYVRNDNAMHNFEVAGRIKGESRERSLYGMSIKHTVSIDDIRDDIDKGKLPTEEILNEKFGDAINYLILEKASVLHRIKNQ